MNFCEAINQALHLAMAMDKKVICYGLGIDDPMRIFGTTKELSEKFGKDRVFDVPTSENSLIGIGTGLAIGGFKPIFVSQRFDFILLAMDQIVNAAAKWYYMFGSRKSVPIVIRLIVGRGWGQGPTHSQSLHSWFSHIPGLKVVMPSNPYDAKGLLLSSIFDKNPVIFIEHRWLYNLEDKVPLDKYFIEIGKAKKITTGKDITIVSNSFMTIEGIKVEKFLKKRNISIELIDMRSVRPIDWGMIFKSIKKTGRLIVLDSGSHNISVASEIISRSTENCWKYFKSKPLKVGLPDNIQPTSYKLTKDFYPNYLSIIKLISNLLKIKVNFDDLNVESDHDIPGNWFKGPF